MAVSRERSVKGLTPGGFSADARWVAVQHAGAAAFGLLLQVVLARLLRPSDYGPYLLAVSISTAAAYLCTLGMPTASVRILSVRETEGPTATSFLLRALLVVSIGSAIAIVALESPSGTRLIAGLIESTANASDARIGIAALLVSKCVQMLVTEAFRGLNQMRSSALIGGLLPPVISIITIVLLRLSGQSVSLLQALLITSGSILAVSLVGGLISWPRPSPRIARLSIRTVLVSYGLPLSVYQVAIYGLTQIDIWVVANQFDDHVLAVYGVAARTAGLLGAPLAIVTQAMMPRVAAASSDTEVSERWGSLIRRSTLMVFAVVLLAVAVLLVWGPSILGLVFGHDYRSAWPLLIVLSVGQLANTICGPCAAVLLMRGHMKVVAVASLFTTLQIAATGTLVSAKGPLAVAAVASVSLACLNVGLMLLAYKRTDILTFAKSPFHLGAHRA